LCARDATPLGRSLVAVDGKPLDGREGSVADKALLRVPFTYTATGSGTLALIARASGGADLKDGVELPLVVRPWSIERRFSAAGRTDKDAPVATQSIELP